jgi:hypothetical protein
VSLISAGMKREQIAKTIGCTPESLRWWVESKKRGLVTGAGKVEGKPVAADATATTTPATSAPLDPGARDHEQAERHATARTLDERLIAVGHDN